MMIAVMGASGNTGRRVAEKLMMEGQKVRALGRSIERLASMKARGAEVCVCEASDSESMKIAFDGCEAAYLLLPPDLRAPDLRAKQDREGEAITSALRSTGVGHVVFLSSLGADLPAGNGPIAGLHAQEERLKSIPGLNAVCLRPGYFFENFRGSLPLIKSQGINAGAVVHDLPVAMIATRDIADVAASALKSCDFHGISARELLGERDLTFGVATRILGECLGKPGLRYVQYPSKDWEDALVQAGCSRSVAGLFAEMAEALNQGLVASREGRKPSNSSPTPFEVVAQDLARAYA